MVKAQEWLDNKYPVENRKNITKLEIDSEDLEGELDLSEFTNLSEITINNERQRNWENFYQWLNDNIVDINEKGSGKGNIKANKRNEYPNISGADYNGICFLMNGLEFRLEKAPIDYTGNNYQNQHKEPLLPYDDNKTFFQLANGQGNSFKCGYAFSLSSHQNFLNDYEKLLKDWRNSTSKININIKLGQDQKIIDLEKIISKLNIALEEVSNELLEIKRKELESLINDVKSKLDENFHDYLDILLLSPDKSLISEKAKRNLSSRVNGNDLQELILLQHKVNHLEERIDKASSQQSHIEVLPPSYN